MRIISIKSKLILIFAVIAILIYGIINYFFLFNPLSYRKDSVTTAEWYEYKEPIEVVYYYWDTNDGWKETNIVRSKKEALYIVSELKKTTDNEKSVEDYLIPYENRGRECKVIIRRVTGKADYQNMIQFDYFENGDITDIGNNAYIKLTKDIKKFLLSKL